jgi:hypothetical protein
MIRLGHFGAKAAYPINGCELLRSAVLEWFAEADKAGVEDWAGLRKTNARAIKHWPCSAMKRLFTEYTGREPAWD